MRQEYTRSQKTMSSTTSGYKDHNGKPQVIGWWENEDDHTDRPVMDTCLTALQLTTYYRYSLSSRSRAIDKRDILIEDDGDIIVIIEN